MSQVDLNSNDLESLLATGLAAQGIECEHAIQQKLLAFVYLLQKWNKVYNLTAITDPHQSVIRHILDSLSIVKFVRGPRVLDVGAGAGLPGVPLALINPSYSYVECECVTKKTRFIHQAIIELGLQNVTVTPNRVELLWQEPQSRSRSAPQFDTIISRAFSSIADMIDKAGPLCRSGGSLLAMKGAYPEHELADITAPFSVHAVEKLEVYGLDEQRTLIELKKQ